MALEAIAQGLASCASSFDEQGLKAVIGADILYRRVSCVASIITFFSSQASSESTFTNVCSEVSVM